LFQATIFFSLHVGSGHSAPFFSLRKNCFLKGPNIMTADHRFMTYTRLEKAYRRILARRMPVRQQRRKLQTRYRQIVDAVGVNVPLGKGQSESLTLVRQITVEGQANARPLSDHSSTPERIIA
jgi:hypothetical protein